MKHLTPPTATAKSYMKHIRNNINSTKNQGTPLNEDKATEQLETRSNHVFPKFIDPQQRISANFTGRLPVNSNRGNEYLFILYDYDRNFILVRPMKNRVDKEFIHVL